MTILETWRVLQKVTGKLQKNKTTKKWINKRIVHVSWSVEPLIAKRFYERDRQCETETEIEMEKTVEGGGRRNCWIGPRAWIFKEIEEIDRLYCIGEEISPNLTRHKTTIKTNWRRGAADIKKNKSQHSGQRWAFFHITHIVLKTSIAETTTVSF